MDEDRTKRPGYGSYGEWEWDDDHPLVDPHSLTQADVGDPPAPGDDRPLYDGRPIRDPYARRGGYRRVPDEAWDAAKKDYLAGEAVALVCARHGLSRSGFYDRGGRDGWLNQPRGAPEPVDLEAETAAGLPVYGDMARCALVRLNRAVVAGRGAEAAVWMRLHQRLLTLADSGRDPAVDGPPPAPPAPSPPPSPQPSPSPRPRPKPASRPADPLDLAMTQARLAETLARSAGGLLTLGEPGRRLIDKGMEALAFLSAPSTPDSDVSDVSDTVFSSAADQPGAAPQGPP